MQATKTLGIMVLALTLAGCATIISGKTQLLTVNSNVQGAQVYLNDQLLGTTPLSTEVKRGEQGLLRVSAQGYQPFQIALNKKVNSMFWVNIFTGGVWGSSTDYSTGAMYEYEPSTFMATLQPTELSTAERSAWERREGLRSFVLLNHQAIVSDLALGSGEYLDVLIDVLAVNREDRTPAIERWRNAYDASETALEFAEAIMAELR